MSALWNIVPWRSMIVLSITSLSLRWLYTWPTALLYISITPVAWKVHEPPANRLYFSILSRDNKRSLTPPIIFSGPERADCNREYQERCLQETMFYGLPAGEMYTGEVRWIGGFSAFHGGQNSAPWTAYCPVKLHRQYQVSNGGCWLFSYLGYLQWGARRPYPSETTTRAANALPDEHNGR